MQSKSKCLGATLLSAALALSGCGGNDSKALTIAEQLVTQSLKSPSSFSATSTKIVFKGVNKEGDPAYIVRVDYNAQNGFGAMLSGCNLAAFYLKSDNKFGYNQNGLDSCMGSPGTEDEAFGIEIDRRFNKFMKVADVKPEPVGKEKGTAASSVPISAPPVAPPGASSVPISAPPVAPPRDFQAEANAGIKIVNPTSVNAGTIDVNTFTNKHPSALVTDGRVNQKFRILLGNDFEEFLDYLAVASDVTVDGNQEIFGHGMAPHSGGDQAANYVIAQSGKIYAILFDGSTSPGVRIYGAPSIDSLPLTLRNLLATNR